MSTKILVLLTAVAFFPAISTKALAATGDLDYPELLVTPRASQRLEMEAKKDRPFVHLPLQIASATTLAAAAIEYSANPPKDTNHGAAIAGIAVGGGWLVASMFILPKDPYSESLAEVNALPNRTPREQLTRERMAEEAIERAASYGRKIMWLSTLTNFGANTIMLTKSESNTFSQVADLVAMGVSLTPFVFRYPWQTIAADQQDYKKKIYAPIASAGFLPEPVTGKVSPALSLAFEF